MKTFLSILCILAAGTFAAPAETIVLKSGRTLKDAEVVGADIDSVRIRHEDGIARVLASDLPDDLRSKWNMLPDQVEHRKLAQAEEERIARETAEKRAGELRAALSESEKIPRYLQPADVYNMFSIIGDIQPVEAQYMSLKWNLAEANRVGLPDQAKQFAAQLSGLEPQMQQILRERQLALKQWDEITRKMEQLAQQSQAEVGQLKQQIGQLQSDLNSSRLNNRTVIIGAPTYYNPYPPRFHPPRPVRPILPPIRIVTPQHRTDRLPGAIQPKPVRPVPIAPPGKR